MTGNFGSPVFFQYIKHHCHIHQSALLQSFSLSNNRSGQNRLTTLTVCFEHPSERLHKHKSPSKLQRDKERSLAKKRKRQETTAQPRPAMTASSQNHGSRAPVIQTGQPGSPLELNTSSHSSPAQSTNSPTSEIMQNSMVSIPLLTSTTPTPSGTSSNLPTGVCTQKTVTKRFSSSPPAQLAETLPNLDRTTKFVQTIKGLAYRLRQGGLAVNPSRDTPVPAKNEGSKTRQVHCVPAPDATDQVLRAGTSDHNFKHKSCVFTL
jgi:hypothetical protein